MRNHLARARLRVAPAQLAARFDAGDDRGDVPGWVLITVLTALIVTALIAIAGPLMVGVFEDAVTSVSDTLP